MPGDRTALVLGGGIGGLCAAIALRRVGFAVALFEQAPEIGEVGAGLSLWPNALKALDHLGVGPAVRAMGVTDFAGGIATWRGEVLAETSMRAVVDRFGAPMVVVHRAELVAALRAALGPVSVRTGVRGTSLVQEPDGRVRLRLADGTEARGDLLVGADGLHSVVRRQLFPRATPRYAGYTAWRAVTSFAHARVPLWAESWGPGARFGVVPVRGDRVYWYATENAPEGRRLGDGGELAEPRKDRLLARFGGWHDPIPVLLAETPADSILHNDIYDLDPLAAWGRGAVTLLGDAAHAMTPNIGQGACQAIEDAVVLGACLGASDDVDLALRRYESLRRARTARIVILSRRVGWVAQWEPGLARALRDRALRHLLPADAQLRQLAPIVGYDAGAAEPEARPAPG